MAQKSPAIAAIGKSIATRMLQELTRLAENDPEKFAKIWENFGAVLKEGLHEDPSRRDALFALARFATTKSDGKNRTLQDYVADLRENQTAIYYITGDDVKRLAASPQIEGFRARGVEVLLLDDSVDAFWVTSALGFDGKPFKSVTQGQADIDAIPRVESDAPDTAPPADMGALVTVLKETLAEYVEDVRVSTRLTESAACLIASDKGLDRQLARLLAEHGQQGMLGKPVLEINAKHPAVAMLSTTLAEKGREVSTDGMYLLLDLARVADGEQPVDASAFVKRLGALIAKGV